MTSQLRLDGQDQSRIEQDASGPVRCLGLEFESEAHRREHFRALLAEKLKDSQFRNLPGFPVGTDEDILSLSDPPYYTACPNPWIRDLVRSWEEMKPSAKRDEDGYFREPFVADVSDGKNDPVYMAHTYHTKVPYKAVMRYILHYTEPGDIVYDGFCGTGMTGIAAHMCGDREAVASLGYRIGADGRVLRPVAIGGENQIEWVPFSRIGVRHAVLNDLSPAATFIAHGPNTPGNPGDFEHDALRVLDEVEAECGRFYATAPGQGPLAAGVINYTVWSDVYRCSNCSRNIVFWDAAVDRGSGAVLDEFACPSCGATQSKRTVERVMTSEFSSATNSAVQRANRVPVLINYSVNGKRSNKTPDESDVALARLEGTRSPYWYPTDAVIDGQEIGRLASVGIKTVDELLSPRANYVLSTFRQKAGEKSRVLLALTASILNLSWMYRWRANGKGGTLSGTYYVCATPQENNALAQVRSKVRDLAKAQIGAKNCISCGDAAGVPMDDESADYIFVDPPFGANLMYSELSFLWEAWLRVFTNQIPEAIENDVQSKGLDEYRGLMTECFREAYRVLKPGRWLTVEFSNTRAAVWNGIQTALADAGFVVASVTALDKQQGSFKAVTTSTAVKQDLVISAYKPPPGFQRQLDLSIPTESGVWDFVHTHLAYLPVARRQGNALSTVPERDPRILFDQVVALHVRHGRPVPLSSGEFQVGLAARFVERDGMYFLPDQAVQYDKQKASATDVTQRSLFVSGEASAIEWLRSLLSTRPSVFSDINPLFMKELAGWDARETHLELAELLSQNFLLYDGRGPVPSQIKSYLSTNWRDYRNLEAEDPALRAKGKDRWYVPDAGKAADLEKLRERHLLKEFEEYRESKTRKIRTFRTEAIRAGFKRAYDERDWESIVAVAERLPDAVVQEDEKLLMYYDVARMRVG